MSEKLRDRAVLITGASAGIGRALAAQLVGHGCRVVAAARSADRLRSLSDELGEALVGIPTDIRDEASVRRLAEMAEDQVGPLDVVVNNAAIGDLQPFLLSHRDRWQEVIDTNLFGALRVVQAVLPAMLAAGHGLIVNVGSSGAAGWPYVTLYAASKAALQAATVSLDQEYASRGVRVLLVEMHSTFGTEFSSDFDPRHMAVAAEAWTALGIGWDRDLRTARESAGRIVSAIESALTEDGRAGDA